MWKDKGAGFKTVMDNEKMGKTLWRFSPMDFSNVVAGKDNFQRRSVR